VGRHRHWLAVRAGPDAADPAALERHDGPVIAERITGQARMTDVGVADDRGTRFQFRFVPDLIVDP
jgi:hypothetical protein